MTITTTIEHVVDIDAQPDIVYRLWTTSAGLEAWWGSSASADASVGGEVRVDIDGEHVMVGRYTALEPTHLVSFTFGWEGGEPPPGATRVDVMIAAIDTGSRVTLRHHDLPVEAVEAHVRGWSHFLGERLPPSAR